MTDWAEIDNRLLDSSWYTSLDYHQALKRLRDEDPVHWAQDDAYGKHYWYLTRYSDIREYFLDPSSFSNRIDTKVPREPKRITPEQRYAMGYNASMARNDEPTHGLYRRPLNKHFSVPSIAKLADSIRSIVDEIILEVTEKGEADLVRDMAAPLPAKVILRMLGVPEDDWPMLMRATERWLTPADPAVMIDGDPVQTSAVGLSDLTRYCEALAMDRRKNPRDDFATVIGNMKVDGDHLSVYEMRSIFVIVIGGGLESTRNAAAAGVWLFLTNPDQRQLLANDPSLLGNAVDEIIRWSTPSRTRMRIAIRDIEFHGKEIKTGDWVVASQASANWDETVFTEPEKFDITRSNASAHLAFGEGIHKCLGRSLLKLEVSTFVSRMLDAFPDMQPTSDPVWLADYSVGGFASLRVSYSPASKSAA
ncbi:cytochrome P450 [Salinibacterium sp. ZJ454]|uniref:cytochrome P450 n=1 Tax=Salinibacterium sp. ZJ454 TaxID=2708339 RepID=UPI0014202F51|nr:cytochrome P450 [Salinibacterium sp. ZJ454]